MLRNYLLFLNLSFRRLGFRYLAAHNDNVGEIRDRPFFRSDRFVVESHQNSDNEAVNDWQMTINRVNYVDNLTDFVCKYLDIRFLFCFLSRFVI